MQQLFRFGALTAVLAGLLLAGGCGNKGALYIPEPPPEAQPAETENPD